MPIGNHAPAANTAATCAISGAGNNQAVGGTAYWSYDGTPQAGANLTINDAQGVILGPYYITSGGPGFMPFPDLKNDKGENLTAILSAGGASVKGSVSYVGNLA